MRKQENTQPTENREVGLIGIIMNVDIRKISPVYFSGGEYAIIARIHQLIDPKS